DMLRFHSGMVLARCLVIIRCSWPTSPPPEKRQGALGCRQAIGIANLPDLRTPGPHLGQAQSRRSQSRKP
ncbi:hypothetical protein MGSAQ_003140, partial [marine sediment metagenome]